jgi:hemolysin III
MNTNEVSDPSAPLLGALAGSKLDGHAARAFQNYLATCRDYQVKPCADAIIGLQSDCERLAIEVDSLHPFGNLEVCTLATLLEEGDGSNLGRLRMLNLSKCRLGLSGVLVVARLLANPQCKLEELDLSWQRLGSNGARALVGALRASSTLRKLRICNCMLSSKAGECFVELLQSGMESTPLKILDMQSNLLGYQMCHTLYKLAAEQGIDVCLDGNRVFDEVLNAVTHGIGFVLSIHGNVFMGSEIRDKPEYYAYGLVPFCIAMIALFLSSTLYHSFHALGRTVNRIFCILDHTAIYLLIAGSFNPLLVVILHDLWWSHYVLAGTWAIAVVGIIFTIRYEGPLKMHIENFLYLAMGWSVVPYVGVVFERLPNMAIGLLAAGGLMYTLGVPWFVKDGHTLGFPDHVIWHIFVLLACACHFFLFYWYVALKMPA